MYSGLGAIDPPEGGTAIAVSDPTPKAFPTVTAPAPTSDPSASPTVSDPAPLIHPILAPLVSDGGALPLQPIDLGPGWEGSILPCPNPVLVEAGPGMLKFVCPEPTQPILTQEEYERRRRELDKKLMSPEDRQRAEARLKEGLEKPAATVKAGAPGGAFGLLLVLGLVGALAKGKNV